MRFWFGKSKTKEHKNRDYMYLKNEEQLQREKISLQYDLIRSMVR